MSEDLGTTLEAEATPDPSVSEGEVRPDTAGRTKSKLGRRILAVVLIVLILLMCGIGYFLFKLMIPEGAPSSDLGGVGWIRSIYGFGKQPDQLTSPSGAAIDPRNGTIWLADPAFFRLVEYNGDGSFVSMIRPSGEDTAQPRARLRLPADIAMDDGGLIYVAEPTYDVVRVFRTDGEELGEFGVPQPLALAVNEDYIVVGSQSGVAITDKTGAPVEIIGTRGRGEDQFDTVNGVAIDENNIVYAVDTFNNRLSAWTVEGENVWKVQLGHPGNSTMTGETSYETTAPAALQTPMGLTIDGNGRLVVVDMLGFSVAVFDTKDGSFIAKYGQPGTQDGAFMYASDIDYDPSHDWFVVSDTGAKRAQIITLPDSGGSLLDAARRSLAGPLKACLFPLLLLILVLIIAFVVNRLRRRRDAEEEVRAVSEQPAGAETE